MIELRRGKEGTRQAHHSSHRVGRKPDTEAHSLFAPSPPLTEYQAPTSMHS